MKYNKAFEIERKRQELASKGDLVELKKLYSAKYPEIKDLNTGKFWDERIDQIVEHVPPDGMTTDRIKIAYSFMPINAKRIMDIGAGYGYIERLISNHKNIEIFGNDISKHSIINLQNRFKGKFKLESIYQLKYPKGHFDAVFALEVLEHVPPSKILGLYEDIKKILKKGGFLILSIPTNEGLEKMKDNPNSHLRMYTQRLIEMELKIAGFEVVEMKTLSAFKNMYLLKKLISRIFPHKWEPNDIIVKAKSL